MKTRLFFSALIAASLLTACSNEDKTEGTTTNLKAGESNDLAMLQNEAYNNLMHRYRVRVGREKIVVRTPSGGNITLDGTKLRLNGKPVTGDVTIEYMEVFNAADMITANVATMGLLDEGGENGDAAAPLESGGAIYVNITQEGQNLDNGTPYQVEVPTEATGGGEEGMIEWTGEKDEEGDMNWTKDKDEDGSDKEVTEENGKYKLNLERFGWCNIDKFAQFANGAPLTDFYVDVPQGYNNGNCKVYLIYQGVQNMAGQMDHYDPATQLFSTSSAYMPVGINLHVIFLSGSAGSYQIAVKTVTVSANQTLVINPGDINPATPADVTNIINYLP